MTSEAEVLPGVRERACRFPSGGETLAGILSLPAPRDNEGPAPARGVIVLHGWGSYRAGPHDMLVKLARTLASRGVPALRFDHRGRGESSGEFIDTDLDGMIDDAVAAAAFLKAEAAVGAVAAVGLCSGANVALGAAANEGAFERVVALSVLPFQSHKSAMQNVRRTGGLLKRLMFKALRPSTWWRLFTGRVRVLRVFRTLFGGEGGKVKTSTGETRNLKDSRRDLMGALGRFKGGLLFVWGGADSEGMGAREHFQEFARARALGARFETIEGSNHNYYSLAWERRVIELAADFVAGNADS